jgi:phosphoglycolate phosphatase-like HAD superfamily hydrolase
MGLAKDEVKYFLPKVLARMDEVYRDMEKEPVLNEGVEELLRILSKSKEHVLGVLTGNISAVAKEKLTLTGIGSYFTEGFYADNYFDRNQLIEDAVGLCVSKYQLRDRMNVMIVGDTPRDVNAANAAKATSIGIGSSQFSASQLSQAHPTWVFANLKPSKPLLRALQLDQQLR